MEEKWRKVRGYHGRYEVSNTGKVKSYAQKKDGKLLSPAISHKGYPVVVLSKENHERKTIPIHRLVAKAFIANPRRYPQVNHRDEVKTNNYVDNLEWCTNDYNARYGTRVERTREANLRCPTTSLKVYSVDCYGNEEHYESIGEAQRQTGLSHCNIVRTLKGRSHTCGKRHWYYE